MISVLVNAYACNPNWGSEPGMGWNWIVNIATFCKVYVITEGEWKDNIEFKLESLSQKDNIKFFYIPVNDKIRRICWNQGDWRFYYYYYKWQKLAYKKALEIVSTNKIDIIHQLNMIGFREPGFLWKIKDIPFIWGPIGGMNNFPTSYLKGAGFKYSFFVYLKNTINVLQMKYSHRVSSAIKRADILIAAVPETRRRIIDIYNKYPILINETGCNSFLKSPENNLRDIESEYFDILWVGHFYFRKQLCLALKVIANCKNKKKIRLHIVGGDDPSSYKRLAAELGIIDNCIWHGALPNENVHLLMQKFHLFLFTSVVEDTSTVVLEAIENHLPVLCFNACGFSVVVDDTVGHKIELSNIKKSIDDFSYYIDKLFNDRSMLKVLSNNCQYKVKDFSWESKMKLLKEIYESVIN